MNHSAGRALGDGVQEEKLGGGRDAHHGREETADKTRDDPGGGTARG